jgi:hypothetical protein
MRESCCAALFQEGECAVRASVVHKHDFVRAAGDLIQRGECPAQEFRQHRLFIVQRNRNGETKRRIHVLALPS